MYNGVSPTRVIKCDTKLNYISIIDICLAKCACFFTCFPRYKYKNDCIKLLKEERLQAVNV